jgi:hypothetical protein
MRATWWVAVVSVLLVVGPAEAQEGIRFGYGSGFTAENGKPMGLAASVSAEFATFIPVLDVRLEGIFQQAEYRDLFFMTSLKLTPVPSRPALYGIAGAGTYLDNGANFAWSAGAGVDLGELTRLPLFLEYRTFFAREQFSSLTVGVHF